MRNSTKDRMQGGAQEMKGKLKEAAGVVTGNRPFPVFKFVAQRNYRYMKRHSRTAGETYYANTCECGANFGDFYLFSEPGGAFLPDSDEAAASIQLETLPFTGTLRFASSYSVGIGEYILRHAKRGAA